MPDDLEVSGGSSAVSTEDLEVAAEQLARLAGEASALAADLGRLEPPFMHTSSHVDQAALDIDVAASTLQEVAGRAHAIRESLVTAARVYELSERMTAMGIRFFETVVAHSAGSHLPGLLIGSAGLSAFVGGVWIGLRAMGGLDELTNKAFEKKGIPSAPSWLREHNYLINNPVTATAVRVGAQSSGPFLLGAAGAPGWVPPLLGHRAYELASRGLIGGGRSLDLFEQTGVKLVETQQLQTTAPPRDYVDRLARVPYEEDGSGPQVVIEKYTAPGEPDKYCVYITGTADFNPATTDQPWDMTSNLENAAGRESGSAAAVRAAMESAGIDENSPVQFTGYSQGGGTAASLVASGLYNTQGLTTFGGPTGQIPIPSGFPTVLVEHSDDIVPALGGEQSNAGAVLVRRDVFSGEEIPTDYAVVSHHIEYYLQTARLMDESGSPQLDQSMRQLDAFTDGATLESSTAYRFERTEG